MKQIARAPLWQLQIVLFVVLLALLALLVFWPLPAHADEPTASTTATVQHEKVHRIYVRAGVIHVQPLAQSREMELADVDGPASLAVQNGPIAGSGATISSATTPGLILGYVLPYYHDKISIETILGVPATVTFKATGTLANDSLAPTALGLPTGVQPLGSDLGEAKAAPLVLTGIYRFGTYSGFTPFGGGGLAVLFSYDAKVTNKMLTDVSEPKMSIDPAPGLVFQAGIDAKIYKRIYARLDIKFIALMLARAKVEHVQVRTPDLPLFDTVEVGTAKMSMWVNPLIIQAGIGADF